jgi:hypothetical protein
MSEVESVGLLAVYLHCQSYLIVVDHEFSSPGTRRVPSTGHSCQRPGQNVLSATSFKPGGEVEGGGSELVVRGDSLTTPYWSINYTISQITPLWKGVMVYNLLEFH